VCEREREKEREGFDNVFVTMKSKVEIERWRETRSSRCKRKQRRKQIIKERMR